MHSVITFNYLKWENGKNLPFPEEIKPLVTDIKWADFEWQSYGLPLNGGKYSLNGKTLYLEELPNGEVKIEQQDFFTGDVVFGSYFVNPNKEENNYLVSFLATFLKGDLVEVKVNQVTKHDSKEYDVALQNYTQRMNKLTKKYSSWWFKYLYRPYRFIVRGIAYILVWILVFLKFIISRIALFLTPL